MTGARSVAPGGVAPWIWSAAETIAAHRRVYENKATSNGLADHLSGVAVDLLGMLRDGVPADQREAGILCLGLVDAVNDIVDGDLTDVDRMKRLDVIRDGLARVALVLAPCDPGERNVFDGVAGLAHAVGDGSPHDVMTLDYATGAAITRADLVGAPDE